MQQSALDGTHEKRARARARFLEVLAGPAAGSIPTAAKAVGVARSRPHAWAQTDQAFAVKMAEAKAIGEQVQLDLVEREIDRRAVEGVEEPVYQKGELVGKIRRYSDLLLMFRAKKLNPAYRDNQPSFIDTPLSARVRMVQIDPDGTERVLEVGAGHIVSLPSPREGETVRAGVRTADEAMKKVNGDAE